MAQSSSRAAGLFQDRAIESPFLTEEMAHAKLRTDIPTNLPPAHAEEATKIRNKLLLFRFKTLRGLRLPEVVDRKLKPRLNQVLTPLMSVIGGARARDDLRTLARQHQRDISADRGQGDEYDRKVTPRWVGLRHPPEAGAQDRGPGVYVIVASEGPKLVYLLERYGVEAPPVDVGDVGNFPRIGEDRTPEPDGD